jgi:hypothetical protein
MTDEPQIEHSDDQHDTDLPDRFLEHVSGAMAGVENMKWDDMDFHLAQLSRIVEEASPADKAYFESIHGPISGFALGFRLFSTARNPQDRDQALVFFTQARDGLRLLRTGNKEFSQDRNFTQFALGIESQILGIQRQMASERGDTREVTNLDQQMDHLIDDMIENMDPSDPGRFSLEANKFFRQAIERFVRGSQALQEMNLDLAQKYLMEASQTFNHMHDRIGKAPIEGLLLKATKDVMEGFALLVNGQDVYVRTLRAAIIGDVNRSDVTDLEKAEQGFLDGADRVGRAVAAMPGLFGGLDIQPIARQTTILIRNLRTLCERSLSPKAITVTTAPKVVFYFLGTFIVLLVGLPLSGLIDQLQFNDIAFLVITSLLVSVLAAFGFEAARLIPVFDAFTRVLPWARQSGDSGG